MNKIMINCEENNKTEILNEVTHICGNRFELEESNIYMYETVDHFSEEITVYYTICPNCGQLIIINENRLTKDLKLSAVQKSENDPLLLKKNILRSQLIYLESITPKAKIRAKIKW